MQTVQELMAMRGTGSGGDPLSSDPNSATPKTDTSLTSGQLQAMRGGTTAISIFSNFAMDWRKAEAMNASARDEAMAGRQEYINAQQRSNAINEAFGAVLGEQQAGAAAGGIDIASGSVTEAKRQAHVIADRELTKTRQSADQMAALRRVREIQLRQAAKAQKVTAILSAVSSTGSAVASAMMGGGGGGAPAGGG